MRISRGIYSRIYREAYEGTVGARRALHYFHDVARRGHQQVMDETRPADDGLPFVVMPATPQLPTDDQLMSMEFGSGSERQVHMLVHRVYRPNDPFPGDVKYPPGLLQPVINIEDDNEEERPPVF